MDFKTIKEKISTIKELKQKLISFMIIEKINNYDIFYDLAINGGISDSNIEESFFSYKNIRDELDEAKSTIQNLDSENCNDSGFTFEQVNELKQSFSSIDFELDISKPIRELPPNSNTNCDEDNTGNKINNQEKNEKIHTENICKDNQSESPTNPNQEPVNSTDEILPEESIEFSSEDLSEIEKIPECFLKYIKLLEYYISNTIKEVKSKNIIEKEIIEKLYSEKINYLLENLDKFYTENQCGNYDDLESSYRELKLDIANKSLGSLRNSMRNFLKISKIIDPININLLKFYYDKCIEAAETTKNNDIIIAIGSTGAGKSTIIQYLGGSEMEEVLINKKVKHIQPKIIHNQILKQVKTSHKALSETRYVVCAKVNLKDFDIGFDDIFYICDSPGLFENRDAETEISNNIGVTRTLNSCQSVRILYVVNYHDFVSNRLSGLRQMIMTINSLVGSVSEYIKNFLIIINKCDKNQYEELIERVKKFESELSNEEKGEKLFVENYRHIKKHFISNSLMLDPLNNSKLKDIYEAISMCDKMEKPGNIFKLTLSIKSEERIKEYLSSFNKCVYNCLKRGDKDLLKYKLNELKFLYGIKELKSLKEKIIKIYDTIKNYIKQKYSHVEEIIKQAEISENFTSKQMIQLKEIMDNVQKIEGIRENFEDKEFYCYSDFIKCISDYIKDITKLSFVESGKDLSLVVLRIINKNIYNSKLISEYFEEFKKSSDIYYTALKNKFLEDLIELLKNKFNENCYDECYSIFLNIRNLDKIFNFYDNDKNQSKYEIDFYSHDPSETELTSKLKINILSNFEENIENFNKIFKLTEILNSDHVEKIKILLKNINNMRESKLFQIMDKEVISNFTNLIGSAAETYMNQMNIMIQNLLENRRDFNIDEFYKYYECLNKINDIQELNCFVNKTFFFCREKLSNLLSELKIESNKHLEEILQIINYDFDELLFSRIIRKLSTNLKMINDSKLIETIEPSFKHTLYNKIFEDILNLKTSRMSKISMINNSYVDESSLKNMITTYICLKEIDNSEISKICLKENKEIQEAILSLFKKITKFLDDQLSDITQEGFYDIKNFKSHFNRKTKIIQLFQTIKDESIQDKIKKIHEQLNILTELHKKNIFSSIDTIKDIFNERKFDHKNIEEISRKIKLGLEGFKEIEDLKNKPENENLFQFINQNKNYNKSDYEQDFVEIEYYFTNSLNDNRINLNIEVVRNINLKIISSLVRFDEIQIISKSFKELEKNYQDFINNRFPDVLNQDDEFITRGDFDSIYNILEDFKKNPNGQIEMKRNERINIKIRDIQNDIIKIINNTIKYLNNDNDKENKFKIIEENLTKIYTIEKKLKSFCDKDAIEELKKNVENKLQSFFNSYRNNIISYFQNCNFYNAEKNFKEMVNFLQIIENVVDLKVDLEELEKEKKKILDLVTENLKNLPIDQYRMEPPKIKFDQLLRKELADLNLSQFYNEYKIKIQTQIENNYRKKIDEIFSDQKSYDQKKLHLEKLINTLNYIPSDMKDHIKEEIETAKEDISGEQTSLLTQLTQAIENDDYSIINDFCGKYRTSEVKKKILEYLDTKVKSLKSNFDEKNRKPDDGVCLINSIISAAKFFEAFKDREYIDYLIRTKNDIKSTISHKIKRIFKDESEFFDDKKLNLKYDAESLYLFNDIDDDSRISDNDNNTNIKIIEELIKAYNERYEEIKDYLPRLRDDIDNILEKIALTCEKLEESFNRKLNEDIICVEDLFTEYHLTNEFLNHLSYIFKEDIINILKENNEIKSHRFILLKSNFSSKDEKSQKIKSKIDQYYKEIENIKLTNENTKHEEKNREIFFKNIFKKNKSINYFYTNFTNKNKNHLEIEIKLINKIEILKTEIDNFNFSQNHNIEILKNLDIKLLILNTIQKVYKFNDNYEDKLSSFLNNKKNQIIRDITEEKNSSKDMKNFSIDDLSKTLVNLQYLKEYITFYKDAFNSGISNYIEDIKKKKAFKNIFNKLGQKLNDNEYGRILISENSIFDGHNNAIYEGLRKRFGIDYVISNIKGEKMISHLQSLNDIDAEYLKELYDEYFKKFKELVDSNLPKGEEGLEIVKEKLILLINDKNKGNQITKYFKHNFFCNIPIILAHINAIFTLISSKGYYKESASDEEENYENVMIPHPAQIIAIFRMLCLDSRKNDKLENNLIQVGTGEGKSIILGLTAVLFGLAGYEVCIVCYSKNLSERDKNAFSDFISFMGLTDNIHYGNLNTICEILLNRTIGGEFRQVIRKYIFKDIENQNNVNINNKFQVLLFDEVDVFFSKEFLGNVYSPSLFYSHPNITKLFELLWRERNCNTSEIFEIVNKSDEFTNCKKIFGSWESLLEEKVKDMINDLKIFRSHQYQIVGNKIGYKENDQIIFNVRYGYKTLFAYFDEWSKDNIDRNSLEENIGITILCSDFSFSEIPKMFDFIFGVSGTLASLNNSEKKLINDDYGIKKYTYLPSIFGKNNLHFDKIRDVYFEKDEQQYNYRINNQIENGLKGKNGNTRAVLVFFRNLETIKYFMKSNNLSRDDHQIISEELSEEELNQAIKYACRQGKVSLITSSFGRGYDFVVRDDFLNSQGGTHVVITYFSENTSEEIQTIGRTARQGNNGSCAIISKISDLVKYDVSESTFENINVSKFDLVNGRRIHMSEKLFESNIEMINQMKIVHQESSKLIEMIKRNNTEEIKNQIMKINKGITYNPYIARVKIYLDATHSMDILIEKTKVVIFKIFEMLSEILKKNNIDTNTFSIQIGCYRNYNVSEFDIFQSSSWEMKPDGLYNFLSLIKCFGGWQEEAVEIPLWDLNQEDDGFVNFAIVIGDSASNSKKDTEFKRSEVTHSFRNQNLTAKEYWENSIYRDCVDVMEELEKIKTKNIPIYGFYVENKNKEKPARDYAEKFFKHIAKETNGQYQQLNLDNPDESEKLANLISKPILEAIGKSLNNEESMKRLMEDFNNHYCGRAYI